MVLRSLALITSLSTLGLISCGQQSQDVASEVEANAAVQGGTTVTDGAYGINQQDVVMTLGFKLDPSYGRDAYNSKVMNKVNSAHFGYLISKTNAGGKWSFSGDLRGVLSQYGMGRTKEFERGKIYTDDIYNFVADISLVQVDAAADDALKSNLRLYRKGIRKQWNGSQYSGDQMLIIAYVNPTTGSQSTLAYYNVTGQNELYDLGDQRRLPSGIMDTTLFFNAATAQAGKGPWGITVPYHSVVTKTNRPGHGNNPQASMGPSVANANKALFDEALTGRVSAETFKKMSTLVTQLNTGAKDLTASNQ